jgi:hypothetical protein
MQKHTHTATSQLGVSSLSILLLHTSFKVKLRIITFLQACHCENLIALGDFHAAAATVDDDETSD